MGSFRGRFLTNPVCRLMNGRDMPYVICNIAYYIFSALSAYLRDSSHKTYPSKEWGMGHGEKILSLLPTPRSPLPASFIFDQFEKVLEHGAAFNGRDGHADRTPILDQILPV
jgi:hypothetical protein